MTPVIPIGARVRVLAVVHCEHGSFQTYRMGVLEKVQKLMNGVLFWLFDDDGRLFTAPVLKHDMGSIEVLTDE